MSGILNPTNPVIGPFFHTGLRISESVGLTINDIEFSRIKIHVKYQLQRKRKNQTDLHLFKVN